MGVDADRSSESKFTGASWPMAEGRQTGPGDDLQPRGSSRFVPWPDTDDTSIRDTVWCQVCNLRIFETEVVD